MTDRRGLRQVAERLRTEVAGAREFTCLISDDAELLRLNRDFLGRDYPADVLSFPSGAAHGPLGDIAISAGRAREQAAALGHGIGDEIRVLMLHGLLHLLGMDHETDRGAMRRAETAWRVKLDLPAALVERTRR